MPYGARARVCSFNLACWISESPLCDLLLALLAEQAAKQSPLTMRGGGSPLILPHRTAAGNLHLQTNRLTAGCGSQRTKAAVANQGSPASPTGSTPVRLTNSELICWGFDSFTSPCESSIPFMRTVKAVG